RRTSSCSTSSSAPTTWPPSPAWTAASAPVPTRTPSTTSPAERGPRPPPRSHARGKPLDGAGAMPGGGCSAGAEQRRADQRQHDLVAHARRPGLGGEVVCRPLQPLLGGDGGT